jgi:hypothetical protein
VPVPLCAGVVIGSGHHLWSRFFFALGFAGLVVVRATVALGRRAGRLLGFGPGRAATVATGAMVPLVISADTAVPSAYAPKQD